MKIERLPTASIRHNRRHRQMYNAFAEELAKNIKKIGLLLPIVVRPCGEDDEYGMPFEVVSGDHRLLAARHLDWEHIDCYIMQDDETACRIRAITENVYRVGLTALEWDNQMAELIQLVSSSFQQTAGNPKGGRPKDPVRECARMLGIDETDAKRAVKVASLTPEAQEMAYKVGLADNRTALLEAANQTKTTQEKYLAAWDHHKNNDFSRQLKSLSRAWDNAEWDVKESFMATYCLVAVEPPHLYD